jgi:chromosomal replication initiation ATPase DnaA
MPLAVIPKKEQPQSLQWLIPVISSLEMIHRTVVEQVGYDFRLKSNEWKFVRPRQMSIWLMRHFANASYPHIGRFYKLHHTTVIHSERVIERERQKNAACSSDIRLLLALVQKATSRENIPASTSGA